MGKNIDNNTSALTKAFKKAFEMFGYEICKEMRLINVLKDFQAFKDLPPAQLIVSILIQNRTLFNLYEQKNSEKHILKNFVDQEISKTVFHNGFSKDIVEEIFKSFLISIECKQVGAIFNKEIPKDKLAKETSKRTKKSTSKKTTRSSHSYSPADPYEALNIKKIDFKRDSRDLCKFLVATIAGTSPSKGNKQIKGEYLYALSFKCDYVNEKKVKVMIVPKYYGNDSSYVDHIAIEYKSLISPKNLQKIIEDLFIYLDGIYGEPKKKLKADLSTIIDYLDKWKKNAAKPSLHSWVLRAYCLTEGIVFCTLCFKPNSYKLYLTILPSYTEYQEGYTWRYDTKKYFHINLPKMKT